jgi:hypothetical protein
MAASKQVETLALIAQATALLPFVSEERRAKLRRLLKRLRAGAHGVGVGASFSATVTKLPKVH